MKPLTVGETARLTGVSVRTLHYYDEIGLLRPSSTSEGGYRLYDEACLARLQQILFFRELAFPLDEIRRILESPSFNSRRAMERHRELLAMKRERLERLIGLVDHILKGDITMDFKPFDASEFCRAQERYAEEAKERWGDSPAYAQSAKKTGAYTSADWARIHAEMQAVTAALPPAWRRGPLRPAQALVGQWQSLITRYFYDCTDEILIGLGEMYVADERFTRQIDRYAKGLSIFLRDAIRLHCGRAEG
jgi:DNA-binding transcriptional MerR regulator